MATKGTKTTRSDLEDMFLAYWSMLEPGSTAPEPGYRFHPERQWEFDFAWIDLKVAVEIEGGTHAGGRHVRGAGYAKDCEKYNAAGLLGWTVLRYTSDMMRNDPQRMVDEVKEALYRVNARLQGQIALQAEISRLNGLLANRISSRTPENSIELERLRTRMALIEHQAESLVQSVRANDDEAFATGLTNILLISKDKPFIKLGQVLNGR